MTIELFLRIIDIGFAVLGLTLVIQIILQWINVSPSNTAMKILRAITEPLLKPVRELMGGSTYQYVPWNQAYFDVAPVMALILLWLGHSLITWLVNLVLLALLVPAQPWQQMGRIFISLLNILFDFYSAALLVRVILGWLRVPYSNRMMRFLVDITEPILAPIRQLLPPIIGLDFSPIIAYFLINLLRRVIISLLWLLF
ncbi:MAG: YggT family protein [Anaerolineales bacterium]